MNAAGLKARALRCSVHRLQRQFEADDCSCSWGLAVFQELVKRGVQ